MFNVNNDDMDEAFRKAAQEYELNDELAANWNGVQSALQHEQPQVVQNADKKRRRFMLWWWLLLVPAALLIAYGSGILGADKNQKIVEKEDKSKSKVISDAPQNQKQESADKNAQRNERAAEDNSYTKNNAGKFTLPGNNRQLVKEHSFGLSDIKDEFTVHQKFKNNPVRLSGLNNNQGILENKEAVADRQYRKYSSAQLMAANNQVSNSAKSSAAIISDTKINNNKSVVSADAQKTVSSSRKDSTLHPASKQKKTTQYTYAREAYKYVGLTGNADLSFIKDQRTSKVGWGVGITGGYHFKNGISIESGVLFDKKNYYTKGKYFDKSGLNEYLQMVYLLKANGNCKMWEVPLNVRYDFSTKKKYNWFAAAGVSSYFMNRENYDFTYKHDGEVKTLGYSYKHSTRDWFSVLNVGGGVNIQSGNKYLLQVQPYYKVPLSGIGKGNLSLSSAGINVGLVRRIK